jgi:hypothetical protein
LPIFGGKIEFFLKKQYYYITLSII